MRTIKLLIAIALISVIAISCKDTDKKEIKDAVKTEVEATEAKAAEVKEVVKDTLNKVEEVAKEIKETAEEVKETKEAVEDAAKSVKDAVKKN